MDWRHYFRFSFSDLKPFFSHRTAILILMAILLYETTGIFYRAMTLQLLRKTRPAAAEATAPLPVTSTRKPIEAYQIIVQRNIFDTTTEMTDTKEIKNKPRQPDVSFLFDLRGTVAGEGKYGFAVIEEKKTRKQQLVKIGDIVSGAKILRIKRSSLDVLIDGEERTMKMAERTETPIVPPEGGKTPVAAASGEAIAVKRSEISAALSNMGDMLRQARMRPYFKGGVPDGFLITNIRPGSLYQRMGLANGDILQGVDGRQIETADDMISLLNTLKEASGAAILLQRGGKPQTLNYLFQ